MGLDRPPLRGNAVDGGPNPEPQAATGSEGNALALAVFLLTAIAVFTSVLWRPQLGTMSGLTDEYFDLGASLRVNGTLGPTRSEPSALRAPGYPAFIAGVLLAAGPDPARTSLQAFSHAGGVAVTIAQALAHALAALALFLWLRNQVDPIVAFGSALAFGLGPYLIVLTGVLHYGSLHADTLVVGCWALDRALRSPGDSGRMLLAGALWGLSALIRPTSMLLPFFLLGLLLLWRAPFIASLKAGVLLALGVALTMGPWTARNYALTGRVFAVTDNNWATLWGQTARPLARDPNRYLWFDLYVHDYMPVFTRVTGKPAYDYLTHVRQAAALDAAFRDEALSNLRREPGVYVSNAAGSALSLMLDPNPIFLAAMRAVRDQPRPPDLPPGPVRVPKSWFVRGQPQPELSGPLRTLAAAWFYVGLALAIPGVWLTVIGRSRLARGALAVGLAALVAQALFFTHLMHYYLRWPLMAIFLAATLGTLAEQGRSQERVARGIALAVAALAALTDVLLLA